MKKILIFVLLFISSQRVKSQFNYNNGTEVTSFINFGWSPAYTSPRSTGKEKYIAGGMIQLRLGEKLFFKNHPDSTGKISKKMSLGISTGFDVDLAAKNDIDHLVRYSVVQLSFGWFISEGDKKVYEIGPYVGYDRYIYSGDYDKRKWNFGTICFGGTFTRHPLDERQLMTSFSIGSDLKKNVQCSIVVGWKFLQYPKATIAL